MKILLLFIAAISTSIHAANIRPQTNFCVACHGEQGNSTNPQWPNIGRQHSSYSLKQLLDFKSKKRPSPIMSNIVSNLSQQELSDLAHFYEDQPLAEGSTPEQYVKRGEALYRGGDFKKHITACIACHGPKGTGNSEANFPLLSGQHALYTIDQLLAFKNKQRHNDLNEIMQDISARMDKDDMIAVAYYIQGLH